MACTGGGRVPAGGEPPRPPNILVIVTDDQRAYDTFSVLPKTKDWFGKGGTRFTNAFATTPVCCPSRASIFTGRYAHNHGVEVSMSENTELLDQSTTVQHHLRRAGYATAMFGKYLNEWPLNADPPGFDEWAIFSHSRSSYYGGEWNVDGRVRRLAKYSTSYLRERAVRFIEKQAGRDKPWLMFVDPAAPHRPAVPERRYASAPVPEADLAFEADISDKAPRIRRFKSSPRYAQETRTAQLRTLMSVDDMVAGIARALERTKEDGNTLAIFMSDNGYTWGENALVGKFVPYQASIRIPMFLRWPGRVAAGAVDDRMATNVDIGTTIFDAARIAYGRRTDGRSLLKKWDRDLVYLEFYPAYGRPGWTGFTTHDHLYVEYDDPKVGKFREYYDLIRDPQQYDNLLADPARAAAVDVRALSRQLRSYAHCKRRACP